MPCAQARHEKKVVKEKRTFMQHTHIHTHTQYEDITFPHARVVKKKDGGPRGCKFESHLAPPLKFLQVK